jgi:hypothetical protein
VDKIKVREFKVKNFIVCIVDGSIVRRDKDIEFCNYGQPLHFSFIPKNEIWIDQEAHPNEMRFFIIDALTEFEHMQKGSSYDQALQAVKKIDRTKRLQARQNLSLQKKLYTIYKDTSVYIVNGNYVRTYLDPTYTEGGHGYVYDYIPKNEVWIDDDIFPKERPYIFLHELIERYLMKILNFVYKVAHQIASNIELQHRRKER